MALVKFFKVTTLPSTLESNAFYYVQNGTYAESYITNNTGTALSLGNSAMINALINSALESYSSGSGVLSIVDTIADRDALVLESSTLILVIDASADITVTSGSALYAWNAATSAWIKVAEYESMDVVVAWESITGRPSSTPAQIDTAVSQSHTHSNKSVLDALTDNNGTLQYNGASVQSEWSSTNW